MILDYDGEIELISTLNIGEPIRKTHIRYRNIIGFEGYINAIEMDYNSEDFLSGNFYKLDTPMFDMVKRCRYGKGVYFKREDFESRGKNCYIPTKVYCFKKCNNYLTGLE